MATAYDEDYYERRGWPNYEYSPYWASLARKILDILPFVPQNMCDVGCAKGYLVHEFRKMGIEAYGVDISDYALSRAFESTRPFLMKTDLTKDDLPFANESFDLVTCLALIEHLPSLDHVLAELKRVLKVSGVILVTTPNPKYWDLEHDTDPTHISINDRRFWKEVFNSYGFDLKDAARLSRGRILKRFPFSRVTRRIAFLLSRLNTADKGWGAGIYGFLATKKEAYR